MYVKDMPSVAANSACRNEGLGASRDVRIDDDLVLDGVIDDRIAAAYAIVELGERDSRKGAEFASSELDEELEVDDLDQYHQVPRSPEYCRKDRRCEYDNRGSSADSSPVRTVGRSPVESQSAPRVGHVKWAVMPSRTSGKPEPKQHPKRRVDEEGGNGIKAKLARMLFEKKVSRTDDALEILPQDDERETGMKYKGSVDSDEERPVESQGGRFVRTSAPLIEPVNVVSCAQSPARYEQRRNIHEDLETGLEQSLSAEQINRYRESLLMKQANEDSAQSRGLRQNASSAGYGVSTNPVCSSVSPKNTNGRFEVEAPARDLVIPSRSSPSPAFPNTPDAEHALSSHDADVKNVSQFPPQTTGASEYFVRETAPLANIPPSWPMMSGMPPYLFLGQTSGSVLNPSAQIGNSSEGYEPRVVKTVMPGTGFVQYFVLPPNSTNPVSSAYLKASIPAEVKQDVDDAMTKLERFTLGNQLYGGSPSSRPELMFSDAGMPYWCVAPQAKTFYPRFGSLSSISNYYGGPASSEAGLYPSNSAVSRSCHDLTRIPSKSPKLQSAPEDLPRQPSPDLKYRRPKSNESAQRGSTRRAQRICKDRRKILPTDYAREKVRGGGFGSLTAIRRYYDSLKSRSAPNLYEQSPKRMQFVELRERAGSLSQNHGEVAQDFPLDLSSYRRKFSTEQRVEVKRCPSELESFSISETSVPVGVSANSSRPWLQDSHAQIGSIERPSDIYLNSQQQKTNIPKDSTTDVEVATEKSSNPSLSHSLSNILPNSSLPPKKRRLRQPSQGRDFSEVRTATSTKSVGSTLTYLQQADSKADSSAAKQSQDSSEALDVYRQSSGIVSRAETGFVLTPEMKLLENKVGARDEDGDLPLHIAVAKGYLEFVQKVLLPMMSQHGVHIDSCNHQRQTALHLAVITNQPQMVETLLNASASASVCDRKGNTAVHLAIKYKTPACLRYILTSSRKQLDLDAKNYEGLTALHLGVQLSERDAVRALLARGADPNAMDGTNGRTPLFYAVETNDYVMASILLKHGSDPCIASYSGCTPLQIATAKSFRDMTNMLERSFPRGFADEEESFRQHT